MKMHAHNVPLFITHFLLNRARFRIELCSSPIPSHQKKGRPSIVPGLPFLVYILNAAFFRTLHSAMVSNGKKTEQPIFFTTA